MLDAFWFVGKPLALLRVVPTIARAFDLDAALIVRTWFAPRDEQFAGVFLQLYLSGHFSDFNLFHDSAAIIFHQEKLALPTLVLRLDLIVVLLIGAYLYVCKSGHLCLSQTNKSHTIDRPKYFVFYLGASRYWFLPGQFYTCSGDLLLLSLRRSRRRP